MICCRWSIYVLCPHVLIITCYDLSAEIKINNNYGTVSHLREAILMSQIFTEDLYKDLK